jgi:hypothetical protein
LNVPFNKKAPPCCLDGANAWLAHLIDIYQLNDLIFKSVFPGPLRFLIDKRKSCVSGEDQNVFQHHNPPFFYLDKYNLCGQIKQAKPWQMSTDLYKACVRA